MINITQVISKDKNLTAFNRGLLASDLHLVLSGAGPFTVFAPSDIAFGKLVEGKMAELLKPESKFMLTEILNCHIVSGKINFKDLKDGDTLTALNGKELPIKVQHSKVSVDGAVVQNRDVESSNGVIHSLDTVLMNPIQVL